MIELPDPVVEERTLVDGRRMRIVRDDLLPGGTKVRALVVMMEPGGAYAYAGPAEGYAQIALGRTAALIGARGVAFVAARARRHRNTVSAAAFGAEIVEIRPGYLTVVKARARRYCAEHGVTLLPFGLDSLVAQRAIQDAASRIPAPEEVWCVAGSGTLSRALAAAWPGATIHAVRVGMVPEVGSAMLYRAPEEFADDAKIAPPFPSSANYDAKAWRFIEQRATDGALFWNVGA